MIRDLRYAVRMLTKRPGFSLVVILTLGLAIGSATAVFDLANLFFWRPPPIAQPGEVVSLHTASVHGFIGPYGNNSFPDFEHYREASESFTGLVAFLPDTATLNDGEHTAPTDAWAVSGDYFQVLGLRAARGRLLVPADDRPGEPPVLVLSHDLWQRLGGEEDVLGRVVKLGDASFTIVGVAPEDYVGTMAGSRAEAFFPSHLAPSVFDPGPGWLTNASLQRWNLLGRLRPGVGREAAQAEVQRHAVELDRLAPLTDGRRQMSIAPAVMGHPIDRVRATPILRLFAAAVGLLLLIACANVASLLLTRAIARRREVGIRQALGAARFRLIRQLLTEGLLLALAGGACGLLLALWARRVLVLLLSAEMVAEMRFDYRVLGLSLLVCVGATLLFGLAPALVTSRVDLVTALKAGLSGGLGRRGLRAGPLLVVGQVALAVVLLCAASLLIMNLWTLRHAAHGFDTAGLLHTQVDLSQGRYSREKGRALLARLADEAGALPGVRDAGTALLMPPLLIDVETRMRLPESPDTEHASRMNFVDAGYFSTLGIALQEGRLFTPQDGASEHGVVVVNRTLAETLWPGESPIGRQLRIDRRRPDEPGPEYEVIGVVAPIIQYVKSRSLEPILYFSNAQRYRPRANVVLRADADPEATFAALRDTLRRLDPDLALTATATFEQYRWDTLVVERLQTQTLGAFSVAGLVLALLGIFGVMSYAVSREVRHIAIRMALGAESRTVLATIIRRGMKVALAGVILGLAASLWTGSLLRSLFAGLGDNDPRLFAAVAVLLLLTALGATYLPARRAARIDPLTALRQE